MNNSTTPLKSGTLTKAVTMKQANFEQSIFDISKPISKKLVYEPGNPLADVE
jgi:hypothetical protein